MWEIVLANWIHSHCILSILREVMKLPSSSYILDMESYICMVGLVVCMSLSGFRSCVDILRLVIWRGGWMNLLCFDWEYVS